jgi:hypothetical protein
LPIPSLPLAAKNCGKVHRNTIVSHYVFNFLSDISLYVTYAKSAGFFSAILPLQHVSSNINLSLMCACDFLLQYTPDKHMFSKDSIYEDFSMDDIDLSYENYEELFGNSHIQTEELFDDAGIDSYFEMKEVPYGSSDEVCSLFSVAIYLVQKDL